MGILPDQEKRFNDALLGRDAPLLREAREELAPTHTADQAAGLGTHIALSVVLNELNTLHPNASFAELIKMAKKQTEKVVPPITDHYRHTREIEVPTRQVLPLTRSDVQPVPVAARESRAALPLIPGTAATRIIYSALPVPLSSRRSI